MKVFNCLSCSNEFQSYKKTRKYCSIRCSKVNRPFTITDAVKDGWKKISEKKKGNPLIHLQDPSVIARRAISMQGKSLSPEHIEILRQSRIGRKHTAESIEKMSVARAQRIKDGFKISYYQGRFKPSKPEKYKGDPTRIIYRSLWEANFMSKLDRDPKVVRWSSEEVIIKYRNPITGRVSRYFPDFYVERMTDDGTINKFLVEIKPKYQTVPPSDTKKKTKGWKRLMLEYAKNQAKWNAAKAYCQERNLTFTLLTEDDGVGAKR